jgi:hypothetical protein
MRLTHGRGTRCREAGHGNLRASVGSTEVSSAQSPWALWLDATEQNCPFWTRVSGPRLFSAGRDVIEDAFMRAYVPQRNADSELHGFVPEDALSNEVLSDLLREWSLPALTTVWAVLGDEDAEAVREESLTYRGWPFDCVQPDLNDSAMCRLSRGSHNATIVCLALGRSASPGASWSGGIVSARDTV